MSMQDMLGGTVSNVLGDAARLNALTGGALSNKDQRKEFMADWKDKSLRGKLTRGLETPQSKKGMALQSSQLKQSERRNANWDIQRQSLITAESLPFPFDPAMGKKDAYSAYSNIIYPKESADLYTTKDVKNARKLKMYLSKQTPAELRNIEHVLKLYNPQVTLDTSAMLPVQGNENKLVPAYFQDQVTRDFIRSAKYKYYQQYSPKISTKKPNDDSSKGFNEEEVNGK